MSAGAAPGERRGGREKGTPNKVGHELRQLARQYTERAVLRLAAEMEAGDSSAARIAACREILDRGWGKARQPLEHTGRDGGPIEFADVRRRLEQKLARLADDGAAGGASR